MRTEKIKLFFLALFFAGLISCEKDKLSPVLTPKEEVPSDSLDTPENCGCGDTYVSDNKSGIIRYDALMATDDSIENKKFWITIGGAGIYTHYMVCNEILLPQKIIELKQAGDTTLNVIISGYWKKFCNPPVSIDQGQLYRSIVLTKIEIQ